MSGSRPQVYLWRPADAPAFLVARSARWLQEPGETAAPPGPPDVGTLAHLYRGHGLLLVRAGVWSSGSGVPPLPRPSASGRGLCAVATPHAGSDAPADLRWGEVLAAAGGAVAPHAAELSALGLPPVLYLDHTACELVWAAPTDRTTPFLSALLACAVRLRVVTWPGLDVFADPRLRVLQMVTSLQRGGAERIALDLATRLARRGVCSRLAAPFQPTRGSFERPAAWLDLARLGRRGETSFDTLLRVAASFDVVHAHLFKPPELARVCATGVPVILTVHNSRAGWPAGFAESLGRDLALLAACSLDVEAELRAAGMAPPVRTVWNGIAFDAFQPSPAHTLTRARLRRAWSCADDALVLLAVANPRAQKRLHLLPPVLAAVRAELAKRGDPRAVRLIFAGQPAENLPDAQASAALVRAEVVRLGLAAHVVWAGAVDDVPGLLAAGDVLVSASAHEGLSLVHLEALAMHRPVVCTTTAGTRETAHGNPALHVLPSDAAPAAFATAILRAEGSAGDATRAAARRHFDLRRMADRYLACYRRCVSEKRGRPEGIWLVTNNFSMGGAQTSARRLLLALAAHGLKVRAVTVQEAPDHPTPGRRALAAAGIPVRACGPTAGMAAEEIAGQILDLIDADPPEAVLFWNLIPVCKLLLADGCWRPRVFDISPGEMFFHSLHQYFEHPHGALPYLDPADYGRRLAGVIVKYHAESNAAAALGVPVHVIPNGVPLPPPRECPPARPVLVFGTATRIHPQKRLEDVIAALHLARPRLPAFVFHVAGRIEPGGEAYHAGLVELAGDLPVIWLGELPDTTDFLAGLDLFLMSSAPAGCPNALLEALAAGLPTIATDVGGAGEQVLDGVTGRLVPARDVAAFAEAIVALSHDRALRARLGHNARAHIGEKFSMARMVAGYRAICLADHAP